MTSRLLIAAFAFLLAACGVKGPPEPPSRAESAADPETISTGVGTGTAERAPRRKVKDRRFILDGLLD